MESKNLIKVIDANMAEFKALSDKWVESNDKSAVAKSRSYAKKLMKGLKEYVAASMADEELVEDKPVIVATPIVEEVIEEKEDWFVNKD